MRQMFQAHKELEGFLLFYGFGVVRVRAKADLGCNEKALGVLLKLVILEYIYIYKWSQKVYLFYLSPGKPLHPK